MSFRTKPKDSYAVFPASKPVASHLQLSPLSAHAEPILEVTSQDESHWWLKLLTKGITNNTIVSTQSVSIRFCYHNQPGGKEGGRVEGKEGARTEGGQRS